MADTTLDNFFAKKHKGKKGKYTTTTTIVKKLEESTKRSGNEPIIKREKEKPATPINNLDQNVPIPILEQGLASCNSRGFPQVMEADDWKEVEEEKEKDYTGLRIQALTLSEKEEGEEEGQGSGEEDGEEGGTGTSSRANEAATSGPWKLNAAPPTAAASVPADITPPQTPEPAAAAPPKVQAYKPPSARLAMSGGGSSSSRGRGPGKVAPEITSELHFPSLSSAVEAAAAKSSTAADRGNNTFQSVRHGARTKVGVGAAPHIDLENKFSALHHQN